jgi:hypothetical protein
VIKNFITRSSAVFTKNIPNILRIDLDWWLKPTKKPTKANTDHPMHIQDLNLGGPGYLVGLQKNGEINAEKSVIGINRTCTVQLDESHTKPRKPFLNCPDNGFVKHNPKNLKPGEYGDFNIKAVVE